MDFGLVAVAGIFNTFTAFLYLRDKEIKNMSDL